MRPKYLFLVGLLFLIGVLSVGVAAIVAQDATCPAFIQTAFEATDQLCSDTGRDQACYGHISLLAQTQPGAAQVIFDKPGDKADIVGLRSLKLSALDSVSGAWGIAQLQLRANLPAAKPENVTMLLFGDVEVNRPESAIWQTVSLTGNAGANVRLLPSANAGVVASIAPGEVAHAVGRLADNSWVQVELPDEGLSGWVYAPLLAVPNMQQLKVQDAQRPYYGPMQAFYFASGSDNYPHCAEVPANGLLIQTPEGAGEVTLLINEVNIRVGSTVHFSAQAGGEMVITTLEGAAHIRAQGVEQTAYAGTQVHVPLSADLKAAGVPSAPEPYDESRVNGLPVELLPQAIPIIPPLTPEEIVVLETQASGTGPEATAEACTGAACDALPDCITETVCVTPDGSEACPGDSCNAPGQNKDECPGNSCNAPGQNKEDKDKDKDK